jgi:DNA-binding FadR family transcriptional regulator
MTKPLKLADKVIFALQKDISLGKYKVGELIPPEPVLMEQFGVGRSTIREAIKTLSNAGVLKVQQGAGTFICAPATNTEPLDQRLRRAALQEVNHVRQLLEVEIVQLAVTHREQADLDAMQSLLQKRWEAIEAENYEACADADIRFHRAVAGASHNSVLADLYQTFSDVIMATFRQREKPHVSQFLRTHDLHVQLAKAIGEQQPELAINTVKAILENNF